MKLQGPSNVLRSDPSESAQGIWGEVTRPAIPSSPPAGWNDISVFCIHPEAVKRIESLASEPRQPGVIPISMLYQLCDLGQVT